MARGRIATPEDEGDDHAQGRGAEASRKRQRTTKGNKASAANGMHDDGNASDSDGDIVSDDEEAVAAALRGWTVDSFTDKPVQATKSVIQQLKKMQESLQNQIGIMQKSISRITDVASALEDSRSGLPSRTSSKPKSNHPKGKGKVAVSDDEAEVEAQEEQEEQEEQEAAPAADDAEEKRNEDTARSLEDKVKQLIDEIKILECKIKALGEMLPEIQQNGEIDNMNAELDQRFERILGNYREASDRMKYKNSALYKEFKQAVWEIRHLEACPPISSFLEKGPEDPESDDDDIEIGGTTQDFKCPLTLLPYEDAVTSTKCVHSFSAEAIRNHITQSNRRSTKCPVAGCDKMISLADIKPNPVLQRKSDQVKARLQRRRHEEEAADAEDAELIE